MNIIVKPMEGICACRPDTTWERENKDIYAVPAVQAYRYTPVLFVRISKAGKCVGYRFAERYYDGFNFGMLLYGGIAGETAAETVPPAELGCTGKGVEGLQWSSCLDHSSILPFPLYNPMVLGNDEKEFTIRKNGTILFSTGEGSAEMIDNAIAAASEMVSLRIGDILAIELQEPLPLAERAAGEKESECIVVGNFLESETFCHRIVF